VTAAILLAPVSATLAGADQSADQPAAVAADTGYAMVTLASPPAATYSGGIPGLARTKPEQGRLDPQSPAYAAYERHLANEHASFRAYLREQAPRAEVVGEYLAVLNGVAVKLNGTAPRTLARGPGVRTVAASAVYRPTMNVSNDLIRASEVWAGLGGQDTAGSGVRVAVIDSGIDLSNPFFDDAGLPAQTQQDECDDQDNDAATPDTNNKVVVCKLFFAGATTGHPPGDDPELCIDHGTLVAGTF
jgi:minor extracellular serine protease Vpr